MFARPMLRSLACWPILPIAALPSPAVSALALPSYRWDPEDTELAQAELPAAQIALVAEQVKNAGSPAMAQA